MEELKTLKWRCRRGTLELDILLLRYLERCYSKADGAERSAFLRLLSLEDSELLHYLLGNAVPKAEGLALLVQKIRCLD
ncbi:FAD assembly factor SdhE [Methylomarinum vadi]|uniref:FAD assembly factor SdhE n=1 Tax=Methylomarinum vadi TaxID=438855 RepID=UPI0004DF6E17|nr:succinate dehydrogenase assembly factor 2 [Methylomarinum vadi]